MMGDASKEVWAHVIPCALRHHFGRTHADSAFGGLSQIECRKAFQEWVGRVFAEPSDALQCPMLLCRKSFDDRQTTVRHTLTCSWLPNAWYWCPQCKRPERFMNTGKIEIMDSGEIMMKDFIEIVKTVPSPPSRRKSSRMKKAAMFFRHCGWSNASKEQTHCSERFDGTEFGTDNKGEIDSLERLFWEKDGFPLYMSEMDSPLIPSETNSELMRTSPELPADHLIPSEIDSEPMRANAELPTDHLLPLGIDSELVRATAELPTEPLFELPGLLITNSAVCTRSDQMLDNRAQASSSRSYRPATEGPQFGRPAYPQSTGHSINGELAQYTVQPMLDRSNSIIPELGAYEIPIVLSQQPAASILEYPLQTEIPEDLNAKDYNLFPPLPFGDVLAGVESWSFQDPRFSYICGLGPTQVSIQEIYEFVGIVSNEWLPRLESSPHLLSRCSKVSPQDLFERGLSAMQRCFNDSLADSFEDMFALVHVACACAYSLHKDEDLYDWPGLFDHMLQWQYLLSSQDDVQCFLMAMDQFTCEHYYRLTNSLGRGGIFDRKTYERTFDILSNGPVMTDCSRFLDGKSPETLHGTFLTSECTGLEHTSLSERNKGLLREHLDRYANYFNGSIQNMVQIITTPLRYQPDTEGFRDIIDDVEFQLQAGFLRNPREVEVLLIVNARSHARSFEAFEKYKRAVTDSCDRAMEQQDPRWRNKYYATAIDKVLAVSLEISNHRTLETRTAKPDISVLAVVRPQQSDGDSPLFLTSPESETTDEIPQSTSPSTLPSASPSTSPSTLGSSASIPSPSTDSPNSYSTSPTTASAGSPTSPASQNPSADVLRCPLCPKTFKPTSGATNLQRHLKNSNAHGLVQKCECHKPGCGKTFTRTDNLNHHIRTVHNESSPLPLQRRGAMKRRRESGDTADIRPKGIRPKGMRPETSKAVILQGQNYDIREKFVF